MPTNVFLELKEEKRQSILAAAIAEFAAYGYVNSSTNRIVRKSGISKGSLFKYFSGKEDLYFFVLDTVTAEFTESLENATDNLSPEIFQRVVECASLEFSWYIQHPEKAGLIIRAFSPDNTEIYQKTAERYEMKELDVYYRLLEDIDLTGFRWDKQKTADILKWFLKGFNEDFQGKVRTEDQPSEEIKKEYIESLTEYLEILKKGLLK